MDKELHHLLEQIHDTDKQIVQLLAKRVQLSHKFYSHELSTKEFHKSSEDAVYEHIKHIAHNAELNESLVKKVYKKIIKHSKKYHKEKQKLVMAAIKRKQEEISQLKGGLQ